MLVPKAGGVAAHPANVYRLLHDERQLVLVFPEGRKGSGKHYKERYRLRRFGRGGFVEMAMRAGVPIVPVAVVGAEEAMPIFAEPSLLQRLTGFPTSRSRQHCCTSGSLGMLGYLPGQVRLRLLEPVRHRRRPERAWRDRGPGHGRSPTRCAPGSRRASSTCCGKRRSVWFG